MLCFVDFTHIHHIIKKHVILMIAELTFSGSENRPPKVGTIDKINTWITVKKGHSIVHVHTYVPTHTTSKEAYCRENEKWYGSLPVFV